MGVRSRKRFPAAIKRMNGEIFSNRFIILPAGSFATLMRNSGKAPKAITPEMLNFGSERREKTKRAVTRSADRSLPRKGEGSIDLSLPARSEPGT